MRKPVRQAPASTMIRQLGRAWSARSSPASCKSISASILGLIWSAYSFQKIGGVHRLALCSFLVATDKSQGSAAKSVSVPDTVSFPAVLIAAHKIDVTSLHSCFANQQFSF